MDRKDNFAHLSNPSIRYRSLTVRFVFKAFVVLEHSTAKSSITAID